MKLMLFYYSYSGVFVLAMSITRIEGFLVKIYSAEHAPKFLSTHRRLF